MPDKKSAPGLRVENKTGLAVDTRIFIGEKDVTELLQAETVQIVISAEDGVVRMVMQCAQPTLDIEALGGEAAIVDRRKKKQFRNVEVEALRESPGGETIS